MPELVLDTAVWIRPCRYVAKYVPGLELSRREPCTLWQVCRCVNLARFNGQREQVRALTEEIVTGAPDEPPQLDVAVDVHAPKPLQPAAREEEGTEMSVV